MKVRYKVIALLFCFLMFSPVFQAQEQVYDSEQQALQEEMKILRDKVEGPGTYEVTLRFKDSNGNIVEKNIQLNLSESVIAINAQDVRISISQIKAMTMDKWKELAQIEARNTETNEVVAVSIDTSQVKFEIGSYPLTITSRGAKKVIRVIVEESAMTAAYSKNLDALYGERYSEKPDKWMAFSVIASATFQFVLLLILFSPFFLIVFGYFLILFVIRKVEKALH